MPCFDLPLEKLKTYMGRNEKPSDFDAFWDRSIAELDGIDPQMTLTPHDIPCATCECFDMNFISVGGAHIHARFVKPKNIEGKIPALMVFHDYGASVSTFRSLIDFASQGYCVAAMDCRGQTGSSEDLGGEAGTTFTTAFIRGIGGAPEGLLGRALFLDAALLSRILMQLPYVDADRVAVKGNSQGGALAIAAAALVPQIKLCVAVFPYMSDYRRVWEMDVAGSLYYDGLRFYFRNFDPLHEHENEFFEKLGYIDIQHLAPRVRAKTLMFTGLVDRACPPSTQFAMYNKLQCEKDVRIFPDYGHEGVKHEDDDIFTFLAQL